MIIIEVLENLMLRDGAEIINVKLDYADDKVRKYTITFIENKEVKELTATYYTKMEEEK